MRLTFETDEAEFDARMEAAEPAELIARPVRLTVTARTAHGTFEKFSELVRALRRS